MNCIYVLNDGYSFNGNTTAYVQMEDGINEEGFAAGLTFIYPKMNKPGFNAGMLIRYLLEKCNTVENAINEIKLLPLASAQTITMADKNGDIAVVECNPEKVIVIRPERGKHYVAATNRFSSNEMIKYNPPVHFDDWRSADRYKTIYYALENNTDKYSFELAKDMLSGKYGFICQYDRKKNADTVWSTIYDLKNSQIWRVEGNPSRKPFKLDCRFGLNY